MRKVTAVLLASGLMTVGIAPAAWADITVPLPSLPSPPDSITVPVPAVPLTALPESISVPLPVLPSVPDSITVPLPGLPDIPFLSALSSCTLSFDAGGLTFDASGGCAGLHLG
jgi:hypothetical protein